MSVGGMGISDAWRSAVTVFVQTLYVSRGVEVRRLQCNCRATVIQVCIPIQYASILCQSPRSRCAESVLKRSYRTGSEDES